MSWKRTIMAGLTLLMLMMFYALDKKMAEQAVYMGVNEASLAPAVNRSEVVEIRLRNRDGEALLVKTDKGQWRVRTPADATADPETIDQLLTNVTGARKRNEMEVKNLAEYGLAAPEIASSLKLSSGKTFELLIGNESTYTEQVFAKYAKGNRVFTVGSHVKNVLVRAPQDFRRARLIDVDVADIGGYKSISVSTEKAAVVLANEKGRWRITSPIEAPAEAKIVEDYLNKVGLLRASAFVTETSDKPTSLAKALQALAHPMLSLTLEKEKGPAARLVVANAGEPNLPVYVAQRGGDDEIMVIRQESLDAVAQDENYFRSRELLNMRSGDVGLFSIEIGHARTDLIRNEAGKWEFVGDAGRRISQDQVNLRLEALLAAKIVAYVEMNPTDLSVYGLQPPRMKFTLTSRDKARSETLETGRSESGRATSVYARRRGDNSIFTMELSPELVILPENIVDKHFASVNTDMIDHFDIEVAERRFAFKIDGGEWKVLRPTQTAYAPADHSKIKKLFETLNAVEYEKDFTATRESVVMTPEPSTLTLKVYGKDNSELVQFIVRKRLQNTSFVTADKERLFEVRNIDIDRLNAVVQTLIQ